jgi:putative DNA primase/helicase
MKPGFRGRGLLGRFLYSLPASPLGHRDTNPPAIPEEICEIYRGALLVLLNVATEKGEDGEPIPRLLKIEPAGRQRLQKFEAWVEPQLFEFGDLDA